MTDAIDLSTAVILNSPQVQGWRPTLRITRIASSIEGGLKILFDRDVPEAWKWPSNPAVPSDNYQYTVFLGTQLAGVWVLAGLVQMWQGRADQPGHPIPPVFHIPPGDSDPGYVNLWGDRRHLWGPLSDYVPHPGDQLAVLVAAGNGRTPEVGVSSVAERSNVVLFTLRADDAGDVTYGAEPPVDPPVDPPRPPVVPSPDLLLARLDALDAKLSALLNRDYTGTAVNRYFGTTAITLTPKS
jgi:hypothetical protein